ncbi:MAG: S8 family serine peptidase, partial [Planctomycetota bacterium]
RSGGGLKGSRLLSNKLVRGALVGPDDKHDHGTGVTGIAAGEIWTNQASDRGHAPLAGIAGYAIATDTRGSSSLSIIAQAWQDIARDKVALGIVAANNSYSGSSDPLNISQQMLDSAALNADILPVVAAGNSGASTSSSQSAANGLAVGATSPGTRAVAAFSSRGPLAGDTQRFYPDLCANGVGTVMPKRDNEAANYSASGTSMASPQVCGAAVLFRSVLPTASALVTKAALLASTEDIATKNTTPPYNTRNAFGLGYLRDDRLVAIARGRNGSMVRTGSVSAARPKAVFSYPVAMGKGYAVVLAWHRHALASKAWSDLNVSVKLGTRTLAASQDQRNLYEKAVFVATQSGPVSLEVTYRGSLDAATVPFALVATEVPPPFIPGKVVAYGTSCRGSGKMSGVTTILPRSYATRFGESANTYPLGFRNTRTQQIFASSEVPSSFTATGIAFRHDDRYSRTILNYSAELEFKLGFSTRSPGAMSTSFGANVSGALTAVMARKFIKLPNPGAVNTSPANFVVKIPLDRPYVYKALPGKYMLFEAVKTRDSRVLTYFVDAVSNGPGLAVSRLFALNPTAATGTVNKGYGVVVGFSSPTSGGARPVLDHGPPPLINRSFELGLSRARASSGALLGIGASDSKWASLALPFDLTAFGATGCSILASFESLIPTRTDAGGAASWRILVPNDKSLIQKRAFFQSLILDPPANRTGIVLTNGLSTVLGGQP